MKKWTRALRRGHYAACLLACLPFAPGCDNLSPEPAGPLLIERLTLLDAGSRDVAVFTDTSAPADCADPAVHDSDRCQSDPFKDRFGTSLSPPTPDSGQQMRVVFNKLPLRVGDQDIEQITRGPNGLPSGMKLTDPMVIALACEPAGGCTAAPPAVATPDLAGSQDSPDPTTFPYGPALQLTVTPDDMRPLAALEPGTSYRVIVSPQLGDRDGNKVQLDAQALAILKFTTEPFRALQAGGGDAQNDAWVYAGDSDGSAASPYAIAELPNDGVVALRLNAAIDASALKAGTAQATAGGKDVAVKVTLNQLVTDMGQDKCDPGDARTLYVFPAAGTWGDLTAGAVVDVVVRGADVRDISQAAGHPAGAGRHTLGADISLRATVTGKAADADYTGLTSAKVRAPADCP